MKKRIFLIFILLILMAFVLLVVRGSEDTWICDSGEWVKHGVPSASKPTKLCPGAKIDNFDDCAKAGNAIMESYPRQCRDASGKTFVENIGNELEKIDLIRLDYPRPNQKIQSSLLVEGEAIGTWFFEGDFPVILTDWDGKIIAEGYASAQSDWMTEDFVSFKGALEFEKPSYSERGTLILQKDNPSDLRELDDALEIPILFK